MPAPTLWIFEDQLSPALPTIADAPKDAPVLLIESDLAFRMFPYHNKRLTFLISAMRHFADELRAQGRNVAHYPLRERGYLDSLSAIRDHVKRTGSRVFHVVEPTEHNVLYWTFLADNRRPLSRNPRMSMILKNLDRIDPAELRRMSLERTRLLRNS